MTPMVYSIHSHEKVAHLTHCQVIRRIKKPYRRTFRSPREAFAAGYCRCRICCPTLETLFSREREKYEPLLSKEKMELSLKNGQVEVQSGTSFWRILQDPETLRLQLFHKNTHNRLSDLDSQLPGYHLQTAARAQTIHGLLKFISSHEAYRKNHPVESEGENGFIPQKFVNQGRWEASKAKKVKKNGRSYLMNVQIRSAPDLSPWLTGQSGDTVRSFGRHNKKRKRRKPTYEPDCA